MDLTIKMNLDNAAFEDAPEAEIFTTLDRLGSSIVGDGVKIGYSWTLVDSNGNTVGIATVTE